MVWQPSWLPNTLVSLTDVGPGPMQNLQSICPGALPLGPPNSTHPLSVARTSTLVTCSLADSFMSLVVRPLTSCPMSRAFLASQP